MKRIVLCVVLLAVASVNGAPAPFPKTERNDLADLFSKLSGQGYSIRLYPKNKGWIDLTDLASGVTHKGIYKWDGTTLTIRFVDKSKDRPSSFEFGPVGDTRIVLGRD